MKKAGVLSSLSNAVRTLAMLRETDFWTDSVSSCKLLLKRLSPSIIIDGFMYQINHVMSADN